MSSERERRIIVYGSVTRYGPQVIKWENDSYMHVKSDNILITSANLQKKKNIYNWYEENHFETTYLIMKMEEKRDAKCFLRV